MGKKHKNKKNVTTLKKFSDPCMLPTIMELSNKCNSRMSEIVKMGHLRPHYAELLQHVNKKTNQLFKKDPYSSEVLDSLDEMEEILDYIFNAVTDEETREEIWYYVLPSIIDSAKNASVSVPMPEPTSAATFSKLDEICLDDQNGMGIHLAVLPPPPSNINNNISNTNLNITNKSSSVAIISETLLSTVESPSVSSPSSLTLLELETLVRSVSAREEENCSQTRALIGILTDAVLALSLQLNSILPLLPTKFEVNFSG